MTLISKFFGGTVATGAGFAFGHATSPVLSPALEKIRQEAWQLYPDRVLNPELLAQLVAQGGVALPAARDQANREGLADDQLDRLIYLAQRIPGWAEVRTAYNRALITKAQRDTALTRLGYLDDWKQPLRDLMAEILTPGELAAAIHRGLVPDPGLLKGEQPQPPFKVEAYPVYDIPTLNEAAGSGYDRDRLGVLVGLQGLPMGTHEAAQAFFRGIITHGDYVRAFNESNSRNEWAEAVLAYARQIPTARDFFENALRGYHDLPWAMQQAERHGMTADDALVIYQNQGRPMNLHQITTALARGGKFKPEPGEIKDPYDAAIVEGNLKPAYYDLAKANRYTLPGPFAIRALAQSGVWSEAKTAQRLKESGWIPEDADEVAQAWTTQTGTATDPHIAKAQTQLWTATHSSYLNRESSATVARTKLAQAGVANAAISTVLGIWDHERELIRKGLSAANVKKAFNKGGRNNATGQPWTRDEALAWLVANGWSLNEANDFLDIP